MKRRFVSMVLCVVALLMVGAVPASAGRETGKFDFEKVVYD